MWVGGERQVSLATRVKQQVFQFVELESLPDLPAHSDFGASRTTRGDEQTYLRRRVAARFAEADISGAVRELASSDGLAPQDDTTLADLRSKHPPAPNDLELPDPPSDVEVPMVASEADTKRAFPSGILWWPGWPPPESFEGIDWPCLSGGRVTVSDHCNQVHQYDFERRSAWFCTGNFLWCYFVCLK